ncbi:MAG: hypothetical protein AAGN35_03330 [Bacteroidota bacterium]
MFERKNLYTLGFVVLLALVIGFVLPSVLEALGVRSAYPEGVSTSLTVLISIVAGAVAYLLYQRTEAVLPRSASIPLGILRYLVLLAVGLLFLEPRLENRQKNSNPPVIAVLQDNSESVIIHRDSQYVQASYPGQLQSFLDKLEAGPASPLFFSFSQQLRPDVTVDSLAFDQSGTNISGALQEAAKLFSNQNLGAVVLISDGISTSGINPLYTLDEFQQPVYTVLLGDTTPQKDVRVAEVLYNEIAYLENETPIKVKVHSTGYENAQARVSIRQGGKVLGTETVSISRTQPNIDVDFLVKPTQTGITQYSISVDPLSGELTQRNNYKAIFINVLETRVKIALFAGFPHPDVGALRLALQRDERYEVAEFIHKTPATFYNDPQAADLSEYDLFILHNFPFSSADAAVLDRIKIEVAENKTPLMVFVGQNTNLPAMATGLGDYLGIIPGAIIENSEEAQVNFLDEYRQHSTYTFEDRWLRMMNNAPPIYRNRSEWKAAGDTKVFGTARIKNVVLDYPVFGLQNHLGRKNMVFVGEYIWRMRAHVLVETDEFSDFDAWIYNIIQWLIVREDKRRFKVSPAKRLFSGSEPILFRGEAYDESYNPLPAVDIKLTLRKPDGNEDVLYMNETGNARYFLELNNLEEGTYSYEAEGRKNEVLVGTDRGQFSIGKNNIEHFRLTADDGLLEQIALRTEGKFIRARDLEALAEEINQLSTLKPVVNYVTRRTGFNELAWIFFVLLGMLAVEWVVRKRYSLS